MRDENTDFKSIWEEKYPEQVEDEVLEKTEEQIAAEKEQARQSILRDAEMASRMRQAGLEAWWKEKCDERIRSNIEALHSEAGEVASFAQQMRIEDNVLKEYRELISRMIDAGERAKAAAPDEGQDENSATPQ